MGMSLSKLQVLVMVREAWRAAVHGVAELVMTEWMNWTELNLDSMVAMLNGIKLQEIPFYKIEEGRQEC